MAAPNFEVEAVSPEYLEVLDASMEAALQVAATQGRRGAPARAAPARALQQSLVVVACELVSATHFALRVPPEHQQKADAVVADLRAAMRVAFVADASPGAAPDLIAPLYEYEKVADALDKAGLFSVPEGPAQRKVSTGGGRIPGFTLKAIRAARQRHPDKAERVVQEEERYSRISQALRSALLPFQEAGVRIGLRRGGRLLLADEVGVGKTLQAIALAMALCDGWPVLVIMPASLRLVWAELLERWWPGLAPSACTVVLSCADQPQLDDLPRRAAPPSAAPRAPRVVVVSYNMLQLLDMNVKWAEMLWGCVIVDESHVMRTTENEEPRQTQVAVGVVRSAAHAILLSGTPALNRPFDLFRQVDSLRPGLLGTKVDFGNAYCQRRRNPRGPGFISDGGTRLHELQVLLRETVLLRREKKDVACELPCIVRQVILLQVEDKFNSSNVTGYDTMTAAHQLAHRKVRAACEWLRDTLLQRGSTNKVVIFALHLDIMAIIQNELLEAYLAKDEEGNVASVKPYVSIRGEDDSAARNAAIKAFKLGEHVRVALLSIGAAATGLDFSSADSVVFVELPNEASDIEQAEARVHRRGVVGDANGNVNVFYTLAHGSSDQIRWSKLSAALANCQEVQNADGAGARAGLHADAVVDASARPAQLPSVAKQLPPCPSAPAADAPVLAVAAREPGADGLAVGVPAASLFFEVSRHTGRLHAFQQDGSGFDHLGSVPSANLALSREDAALVEFAWPFTSPAVQSAAIALLADWKALTHVDRDALWRAQTPLRLPLGDLLDAARVARDHFSTFRSVKAVDVIPPPPDGSTGPFYAYINQRGADRLRFEQYRSEAGVWLCRACSTQQARVQHAEGAEPLVACLLDLCCSENCHDRLRAQTNRGFLRKQLLMREGGKCVQCKTDCEELYKRLHPSRGGSALLSLEDREKILKAVMPGFALPQNAVIMASVLKSQKAGCLWEADHIVPVAEGGGLCGLENMRTLCVLCHREASLQLAGRGAKRRRQGKAALAPLAAAEEAVAAWEEEGDDDFEGAREAREKASKKKKTKTKTSEKKKNKTTTAAARAV